MVVKPSVSGGGYRTARYEPHEHAAARAHIAELVAAGRTAMVQPYEPRVDAEGETALVFVGGRFTHALHKEPMIRRGVGPADSLIDNQVVTAATAPPPSSHVAGRALAAAEELLGPTTYARVDMVETLDRGPALLELELLDPVLFFTHHPEGAVPLARRRWPGCSRTALSADRRARRARRPRPEPASAGASAQLGAPRRAGAAGASSGLGCSPASASASLTLGGSLSPRRAGILVAVRVLGRRHRRACPSARRSRPRPPGPRSRG